MPKSMLSTQGQPFAAHTLSIRSLIQVNGERRTMFDISRRDLTLGAAGAYAAFGLNKPVNFVDAAYAQQSVTQPFRKYTVGDIEVFSLIDGMRDVPLREGMVRNVGVEQVKAADNQVLADTQKSTL
jgi:hypothetical protein